MDEHNNENMNNVNNTIAATCEDFINDNNRRCSFTLIHEDIKVVKTLFKKDALQWLLRNPTNAYPGESAGMWFHIAPESRCSQRLFRQIEEDDGLNIYSAGEHVIIMVPDEAYMKLSQRAKKTRKHYQHSKFFFIDLGQECLDFFGENSLKEMLGQSMPGLSGREEVNFYRKSSWTKKEEKVHCMMDSVLAPEGVYCHYVNLVEDEIVDKILNPKK